MTDVKPEIPKRYTKPSWAVKQIIRDGMVEDICPHGLGHPNEVWYQEMIKKHGKEEGEGYGVHGCDGCCCDKKDVKRRGNEMR